MKSLLPVSVFLSLLLFANTVAAARKDVGEYWRAEAVMKDIEPIPDAIEGLVRIDHSDHHAASSSNEKAANCHDHTHNDIGVKEEKIIVEDFEIPRPSKYNNEAEKNKKSFADDFEPRPNLSAYGDDSEEKSFVKDFEPRPNVSAYGDDDVGLKGEKKSFAKDFEPGPNVSAYGDDGNLKEDKKSFVKDFEPRPNVSAYEDDGDLKAGKKPFTSDFEPGPNVSVYHE